MTHFLEKSLKHNLNLFWRFVSGFPSPGKKVVAISRGPWFTVVPIHPWSTIWRILGSGGSCWVALANSRVFFWISSIATFKNSKCNIISLHIYQWIEVFRTKHSKWQKNYLNWCQSDLRSWNDLNSSFDVRKVNCSC